MSGALLGPMLSYHFDRDANFNEANPGLGYMADNGLLMQPASATSQKNGHMNPTIAEPSSFK